MNVNLKKLERELKSLGDKAVFSRSLQSDIKQDLLTRINRLEQKEAPRVAFWNLPRTIISVPATVFTMVLVFLVGVATTSMASNSRPGQFLWQVRKLAESSDIFLTFDQELKTEKKVAIATNRIQLLAEATSDETSLESVLREARLALVNATEAVAKSEDATLLASVRDLVAEQESLLADLARTADSATREKLALVSQEIKDLQKEGITSGNEGASSSPSEEPAEEIAQAPTTFSGHIGTAYGQPALFAADGSHYILATSLDIAQLIGQDDVLVYGLIVDNQLVVEKIFVGNKLVETPDSDLDN